MRVLFLESFPMWIYGLPNGFRDAGHEVMVSGPLIEENIPKMLSGFKPDLIVSLGWTSENTGVKVDWLVRHVRSTGIPYIFWATEDPAYTECFSLPFIRKVRPDFVFTICHDKVDFYRNLGIKAAQLGFAYHDSIHRRVEPEEKYKCSIAVVANSYLDYIKAHPQCFRHKSVNALITPLLKHNIRIDFWGKDWENMGKTLGHDIPGKWIHGCLPYTEANKVYSSADIVIGIQNRQITQRTYEILGSEGFLLTNNTEAVRKLFRHKTDLLISDSPDCTTELVCYYLEHPKEREKIRKQGKLAVVNDTYKHRAMYIVETLKNYKILCKDLK